MRKVFEALCLITVLALSSFQEIIYIPSWAWWFMPVISALWEAEVGGSLESGVLDQPGQHGETPLLLKNTKISRVWWWAPVIPAAQKAEAGESLEPRR